MIEKHASEKKTSRFLKTSLIMGTFFGGVVGLMLISAQSPISETRAENQTQTEQIVSATPISYQDSYALKRKFVGMVEAGQSSQIGFEVSGLMKNVLVDEGDLVKKGDLLAELDTARLEARKREALASLKRAAADAKLASSTFKRIEKARSVNAVSAQERDEAEEARNSAQSAVDLARAQLETIEIDIEKSQIRASYDGVIIERMRDVGTVVSPGQSIFHLQETATMEARIGVTPKLANKLQIGEIKTVEINQTKLSAIVANILPIRAENRSVEVILQLVDRNNQIRVGDMAQLELEQEMPARGFWIPINSLREGERGLWSVYVVSGSENEKNTADRRSVEIIDIQNEMAFVSGSVDDGESVMTKGAHKVVPGQLIALSVPE